MMDGLHHHSDSQNSLRATVANHSSCSSKPSLDVGYLVVESSFRVLDASFLEGDVNRLRLSFF
jgi:hypothetical protein